jgi:MmyB-like transcription regulator ligand binding domain
LRGIKRLQHPVVGDLNLTCEVMHLAAEEGLTMFAYTAEQGSRLEEALKLLASWAATVGQATAVPAVGPT